MVAFLMGLGDFLSTCIDTFLMFLPPAIETAVVEQRIHDEGAFYLLTVK
jgi:hypothetical protein